MKRTRASLALTLALLALPAAAADRSEAISLSYISALELEQFLTNAPAKDQPLHTGLRGTDGRTLLPQGITAWGIDVAKNSLSVTGSPDSLEQLKQIVRLLDIPARRIELSLQLRQLGAAEAEALRKDPAALDKEGVTALPLPTPDSLKRFEGRAEVLAATVTVSNLRAAKVRLPGAEGAPPETFSFTPQLNGDGSINVVASGLYAGDQRTTFIVVRRLGTGTSAAVLDKSNRVWLISPKVLPDPVSEGRKP